jgi:hypothetical protein
VIFLIEYHRPKGRLVTFKVFEDSHRSEAEHSRLDIELELNRKGIKHEVVLLEAKSKDALRKTHRRYFEDLGETLDKILTRSLDSPAQTPALTSRRRRSR